MLCLTDSPFSSDIKISATSTSSSTLPNANNQLENSQDSMMIPSAIKNSRQTSPFIAESNLNASQDSIAKLNCRSSRSIRSKTIRKKSFKMDNPPAPDLTIDLTMIPCIAMKSSFSTLKWLRCIEQRYDTMVYLQHVWELLLFTHFIIHVFFLMMCRNLKRESQIVWADIDKELLLPYSYSGENMIYLFLLYFFFII